MNFRDITNQTIFQQSPISTQIFSPDGVSLMANKAWEKLWRIKHSQLGIYNVLKDKQLVKKGIMPLIKRGFEGETVVIPAIRYVPGETVAIKEVVSYRWVKTLIYPVLDDSNKIVQIVLQHEDMTDQIESGAMLQFQADILQNITDSVITTDLEGVITYWNKGAEKIFGFTAKEMVGQTPQILYPDLEGKGMRYDLSSILKGKDYSGVWPGKRKDGRIIWVAVKTTVMRGSDNEPVGFIGVASDITRSKEIEQALRQSEERLRLAMDAGKIGVWDWDIIGNKIIWSDRIYEIHGLKKNEFDGTVEGFINLIYLGDRIWVGKAMQSALANKVPYSLEFRVHGPKGHIIWIYTSARVLFEKNKPVRMLGATIDISERKNFEKQKDQFIGLASHELKTPVTSIKAYAQLLERTFRRKGDTKAAVLLDKMDKQIDKLTNLIGDLLDVTRIEEGKLLLRKEHFDFNELVKEISEEVQRTSQRHKIVLKLSKPVKIYGDRERYGQVITNLLTNAIKYSPKAVEVVAESRKRNNLLTFSVRDYGYGIAKQAQRRIFERFFRVEWDREDTSPGLGLGLYISREIVTRQGGKIWVESQGGAGHGSTFYFTVPHSQ